MIGKELYTFLCCLLGHVAEQLSQGLVSRAVTPTAHFLWDGFMDVLQQN